MLSPARLATLTTISEAPSEEDRKQASLIDTHVPELMIEGAQLLTPRMKSALGIHQTLLLLQISSSTVELVNASSSRGWME